MVILIVLFEVCLLSQLYPHLVGFIYMHQSYCLSCQFQSITVRDQPQTPTQNSEAANHGISHSKLFI